MTNAPFTKGAGHLEIVRTGAIINLPAVLVIAAITALCYVGIHQSARFNAIVVVDQGHRDHPVHRLRHVGTSTARNWVPFIPPNTGEFGHFGWSGVVQAAGIIFFAYIGFDAVSTAAQEAKNPQRDMPIGIMASLVICTVLYVAVSAVLTGMVHYAELNTPRRWRWRSTASRARPGWRAGSSSARSPA